MYYILGGGLTGLIIAECLQKRGITSVILTENVGGQFANNYPLGPRILQYSEKVESFIKSIGLESELKEFDIFYLDGNKKIETLSDNHITNYKNKTRPNGMKDKIDIMTGMKRTIKGYDISDNTFYKKLVKGKNIHIVTIDRKVLNTIRLLNYPIISTIHYNDLAKMIDVNKVKDVNQTDEFFYKLSIERAKELIGFDFEKYKNKDCYFYDVSESDIKRFTIYKNEVILESVSPLNFFKYPDIENTCLSCKNINLTSNIDIDKLNGILLEGRYGRLNHKLTLKDVIDKWYV